MREGEEKGEAVLSLLFPLARGLGTNWETGNRREAGAALAHIAGSGKETQELVQAMSRVFKKVCTNIYTGIMLLWLCRLSHAGFQSFRF
jgi:hypothetical protein